MKVMELERGVSGFGFALTPTYQQFG